MCEMLKPPRQPWDDFDRMLAESRSGGVSPHIIERVISAAAAAVDTEAGEGQTLAADRRVPAASPAPSYHSRSPVDDINLWLEDVARQPPDDDLRPWGQDDDSEEIERLFRGAEAGMPMTPTMKKSSQTQLNVGSANSSAGSMPAVARFRTFSVPNRLVLKSSQVKKKLRGGGLFKTPLTTPGLQAPISFQGTNNYDVSKLTNHSKSSCEMNKQKPKKQESTLLTSTLSSSTLNLKAKTEIDARKRANTFSGVCSHRPKPMTAEFAKKSVVLDCAAARTPTKPTFLHLKTSDAVSIVRTGTGTQTKTATSQQTSQTSSPHHHNQPNDDGTLVFTSADNGALFVKLMNNLRQRQRDYAIRRVSAMESDTMKYREYSVLFCGSHGTGKREICRQFANMSGDSSTNSQQRHRNKGAPVKRTFASCSDSEDSDDLSEDDLIRDEQQDQARVEFDSSISAQLEAGEKHDEPVHISYEYNGVGLTLVCRFASTIEEMTRMSLGVDFDIVLVVYSVADQMSFEDAEEFLAQLRDQMTSLAKLHERQRVQQQQMAQGHGVASSRSRQCKVDKFQELTVALVGNKTDLTPSRVVSRTDAKQLAKQFGVTWLEISAVMGQRSNELLFGLLDEFAKRCRRDDADRRRRMREAKHKRLSITLPFTQRELAVPPVICSCSAVAALAVPRPRRSNSATRAPRLPTVVTMSPPDGSGHVIEHIHSDPNSIGLPSAGDVKEQQPGTTNANSLQQADSPLSPVTGLNNVGSASARMPRRFRGIKLNCLRQIDSIDSGV